MQKEFAPVRVKIMLLSICGLAETKDEVVVYMPVDEAPPLPPKIVLLRTVGEELRLFMAVELLPLPPWMVLFWIVGEDPVPSLSMPCELPPLPPWKRRPLRGLGASRSHRG